MGWTASGHEVSLRGDGNVLESESGVICTTLGKILKSTELYIIKWSIYRILSQFNKRPHAPSYSSVWTRRQCSLREAFSAEAEQSGVPPSPTGILQMRKGTPPPCRSEVSGGLQGRQG